MLCPVPWGPIKRTNDGRWAHVVCMHFVAETMAGNVCAQEPVIDIKDVPDERFRMECLVCKSTQVFQAMHRRCRMPCPLLVLDQVISGAFNVSVA